MSIVDIVPAPGDERRNSEKQKEQERMQVERLDQL